MMGTRGAFGFYQNGVTKVAYNHYDSYPDCLGSRMATFAQTVCKTKLAEQVTRLKEVPNRPPSNTEVVALKQFSNLDVGSKDIREWYCLLRKTQGNPEALLEAGFYECALSFLADSLFCEWAYIINLDDGVFEVYRGFQEGPSTGRYTTPEPKDGYYPVDLVATYPLLGIPKDWVELAEKAAGYE